MIAWLKIIHVAALAVWCPGLLVMPSFFAGRPVGEHGPALWRFQRLARLVFIRIISPAAFVAIGSGIALIFAREVVDVWFALKLVAVGALAALHIRAGFVVVGVFRPGERYSPTRRAAMQVAVAVVVLAILWLVLAKPAVDLSGLPDWLVTPGGLQSLSERLIPIP